MNQNLSGLTQNDEMRSENERATESYSVVNEDGERVFNTAYRVLRQSCLFRPEVLASRANTALGPVLIQIPTWCARWGILGGILVLALLVYTLCIPYAAVVRVPGYVEVVPHVARVYPRCVGVVVKQPVQLGQRVSKGQLLQVINTSLMGHDQTQALQQLEHLEHSLTQIVAQKQKWLHQIHALLKSRDVSRREYEQLQQEWMQARQQLTELKMRRMEATLGHRCMVKSPITGKIISMQSEVGQFVRGDRWVLQVFPEHVQWMVWLWVPAHEIRFVRLHQRVILSYDAYPWMQFGGEEGWIMSIGKSVMRASPHAAPLQSRLPFYPVAIQFNHIKHQGIHLYQGMSLQGRLSLAKEPLWKKLFGRLGRGG